MITAGCELLGPLTMRQRKFIDGKLRGKSDSAAARKAGYGESVTRHADRIISKSPNMQGAINEMLDAAGISDEKLCFMDFRDATGHRSKGEDL
jgi:hypothetical protein